MSSTFCKKLPTFENSFQDLEVISQICGFYTTHLEASYSGRWGTWA